MTKEKQRLLKVLNNLIKLVEEDNLYMDEVDEGLNILLEGIHMDDGFGTEGQLDPRGDFRESNEWSMWNVQGVDEV